MLPRKTYAISLFQEDPEGRRIVEGLYGNDCATAAARELNAHRAELNMTLMMRCQEQGVRIGWMTLMLDHFIVCPPLLT